MLSFSFYILFIYLSIYLSSCGFMKVVPVKLSDSLTGALDELVKGGIYSSRNEALKDAVRSLIERRRLREVEGRRRLQVELQVIARVVAALLLEESGAEISRIILFGSAVRGDVSEESDVDLLILVRGGDRHDWRRRFIEEVMPITYRLGRYISIKTFTEEEFKDLIERGSPFVREVLSHGISVHGGNGGSQGPSAQGQKEIGGV